MTAGQSRARLPAVQGIEVDRRSLVVDGELELALADLHGDARLVVLAPASQDLPAGLRGEAGPWRGRTLLVGPLCAENATALRSRLPWLRPSPLGLRTSAGLGDRLGVATRGHVGAVRAVGGKLAPFFAQQSIREMQRTGRTPRQVLDDATWGLFAEGWRAGFGADADHVRTLADLDACVAAGFTLYTIDPGDHVPAETPTALRQRFEALPWEALESTPHEALRRYADRSFTFDGHAVEIDGLALARAAVKLGRAITFVVDAWRRLERLLGAERFELEVSVDETATRTTPVEHVYVAGELDRLGVRPVGLAPRFARGFEKGVEYRGDPQELARDLRIHAAIARDLGPYKLSVHSGSDKFGIYEAVAESTAGLAHLKTSGTSYLEALRVAAALDPPLFRSIYAFACACYADDRASYHVSADPGRAPRPDVPADADLPALLDDVHARQILHVTYGSVLTVMGNGGGRRFHDALLALLRAHRERYEERLEAHLGRHLAALAGQVRA